MNLKLCVSTVLAAAALSGCSTMDSAARAPAPAAAPAVAGTTYQPRIVPNDAYVAHVESLARRRGLLVRWVNKPVKRHVDQQ